MMGTIALSGCEKKYIADATKNNGYGNTTEYFIGQWNCSDRKYCSDGDKISLRFCTDSLYVDIDTKYRTAFPKGHFKYEFHTDTLCIFTENFCWSYVSSINDDKNRISLNYTGVVMAPANDPLPELVYNFRRIE